MLQRAASSAPPSPSASIFPGRIPYPQGDPPQFAAGWRFVSPSTDYYSFSLTKVQAHMYQLTDGALVCVRKANASAGDACIAKGEVDQCNSVRDGGWQRALSHVPLAFNESYEFVLSWDSSRGGYALIDALLIESETLYNGGDGTPITEVTVGAVDARILLKSDDAQAMQLKVGERQLMIDRALLDDENSSSESVVMRMHRPQKTGPLIVTADRPWEGAICYYNSIVQVSDSDFRIYCESETVGLGRCLLPRL